MRLYEQFKLLQTEKIESEMMQPSYHLYRHIYNSEQYDLNVWFAQIKQKMSICTCSELIDTHNHSKNRKSWFIQSYIMNRKAKSFMFLACLN